MPVKIVCISDTHGLHRNLPIPEGDILIHAGDVTRQGSLRELFELNDFFGSLPHPDKIVIAGNHDFCFERDPKTCAGLLANCMYLQDQAVTIQGIKFYGSPWQPWFYDWAFNLRRGPQIRQKWDLIPDDTDVLITHGPPYGCLDRNSSREAVGCQDLWETVHRIRPKLHVFGHIHEGFGVKRNDYTTFINASSCNVAYEAVNSPIVYEYSFFC